MKKLQTPIMVTKSSMPPFEDYIEEIKKVWESSWLTNNGPQHVLFEKNIKNFLRVDNASLFVNGHLALETAIKALDLQGEVITTPFTFASTTHAIVNCGLTPVFCDINKENFNIDVSKIESLITENTSAIIPVHVFGNPCDVQAIQEIANKYQLKVIYDAAHAFGVEINGVGIGNFGDISMFSLHATKVFHSIEGGILTYHNDDLVRKIDLLKNFGISGPENVELVGTNAKMNEFQATMGLINLRYIDQEIEKRKAISYKYKEMLSDIAGIGFLMDVDGVKHNYSYFPILVNESLYGMSRNELHEVLKEYNVFTRKYFYPLVVDFDCYRNIDISYILPTAKQISNEVLTLPLYSSLQLEEVEQICSNIRALSKKSTINFTM